MKKTVWLSVILLVSVVGIVILLSLEKRTAYLKTEENMTPVIVLEINNSEEVLKPWFNKRDGLYYFFLPSCVSNNKVYCDYLEEDEIIFDGETLSGRSVLRWENETVYQMFCNGQEYDVVFAKSANIPALFIESESGTMEYLNADKELVETGNISVVYPTKNVEYQGELSKISARGNSTFHQNIDKKAYSITLDKSAPLCGMDAGKKWNLLAMYFEYDKIHTKMVCDMAAILGMEYNIDCTWVDLYCNSEYQGMYLLTEAVTVGKGRVDIRDLEKVEKGDGNISGGYLLEKDSHIHLDAEGNGFVTEQCGYPFILKSPNPASEEQMDYIKSYIQNIENLFLAGDKTYKEYIDLDSFAKQFLIDKIVLEPDAMNMSTFYYKDVDSDILKAGPLWDYDRAFGEALPDYTLGIGNYPGQMQQWYMTLYEDEEFRDKMICAYKELLPFFERMLETGIDEYVDYVSDAVKMDRIMWPTECYQNEMMSYLEYDSSVKYLKYFLANRLNYLNQEWGIENIQFQEPIPDNEQHMVQFAGDDGIVLEKRVVSDGETLRELPYLDVEKYYGWGISEEGKVYEPYIPVYEDMVLNSRPKFENMKQIAEYKVGRLYAIEELLPYIEALCHDTLSVCVFFEGDSLLLQQKEVLLGIKQICGYRHPEWLNQELDEDSSYFLLIDNGEELIRDVVNADLENVTTTFGKVDYSSGLQDDRHLYIQENGINYLDAQTTGDITFVVINRYTGEIVDVRAFY